MFLVSYIMREHFIIVLAPEIAIKFELSDPVNVTLDINTTLLHILGGT